MDRLYLALYQPGDEAAFTPRPDLAEDMSASAWDWTGGPPPGRTWALMRLSGQVVGIGGLYDHGQGEFEAWSVLGPLRRRDWPRALQLASMRLAGARFLGARRIRAACRLADAGAARCLERLGFRAAGLDQDPRLPGVSLIVMQRSA